MTNLKEQFLLNPNIIFLNHGSFGATPRPVFDCYQEWQRRLEQQPVQFIARDTLTYFQEAREALGHYLQADAEDVVYIPNATFGVNIVARSLALRPDDEVLTTDHEYGACDRAWRFLALKHGFRYVRQPITVPIESAESIVEQLWQGVTPQTKVIYLSHITSETALQMPIEAICHRAQAAGIMTLIDGAHAPGQIPLNLPAIAADFYTGNCHKWMMSPKGSGFLYARSEMQPLLEPLVVSWGWENRVPSPSQFIDHHQWLGTIDPAPYLATPAAIQFQADYNWPAVRQECHTLLNQALQRIMELTGLPTIYPQTEGFYTQMAVAPLPYQGDPAALQKTPPRPLQHRNPLLQLAELELSPSLHPGIQYPGRYRHASYCPGSVPLRKRKIPRSEDYAAKKLEPFCEVARMKGKIPSFGLAQDRLLRRLRSE
jgi:isopenicillin-N epimerase